MTEAGKLVAPDVKAGDRILFGKYSGSEVKLEGEEHMILREDDILGVLVRVIANESRASTAMKTF
jgi:chaperonin GroES